MTSGIGRARSAMPIAENLSFELALLLVVLVLLASVLSLWALLTCMTLRRQIKEIKRDAQRQNTSLLALHGAMKVISEDVISHGQTQLSVRRTLARLADQQSELRLRDGDGGLYPQAIQLIHEGCGREDVRKLCALTESEVDLLFSLHARG